MPVFPGVAPSGDAGLVPYCTIAEARAAGATGTDAEVQAAIDDATELIVRHTSDLFAPTDLTVVAEVGHNGTAMLPRRVRTVTTVTVVGSTTPLATSGYRLRKSSTPGDVDAIEFASYGFDVLVVGAEPWAGGWSALARAGRRLEVVGSFGWDAVPGAVRRACALLAAWIIDNPTADDTAGVRSLSVEGYSVSFGSINPITAEPLPTTGLPEADRLLRPYNRTRVRVG